jgi:hypothetical protein
LTGKTRNTTIQLDENQTLAHIHQLELSVSLIHHVQGSFLWENTGKLVISEILMREAKSLHAKGVIIPHNYTQIIPWLWHINWPYLNFSFTMWKGFLMLLRKSRKNGQFGKFSCTKPNLDRQNTWYYQTTMWESNFGSQEASIGYIYVFDSPCAKVFFPEKTWDKKEICDILMPEGQSWQAKRHDYTTPLD